MSNYESPVRVFKSPEDPRTDAEMAIDDEKWFKFWNEEQRKQKERQGKKT